MRIPRLYVEHYLEIGDSIELIQDKMHYIIDVLRLCVGSQLTLFNDSGKEFDAELIELNKKNIRIKIKNGIAIENESPLKIILGLGISRSQHMDYAIQKAVELGVTKIVPILTEFTNVKIQKGRENNKLTHWRNIIINATEQCGRVKLTKLLEPQSFRTYLNNLKLITRVIFHPYENTSLGEIKINNNELLILVGPEGGFSNQEIAMAEEHDFFKVSLGPRTLRTETAVVTAMSLFQYQWGDLK